MPRERARTFKSLGLSTRGPQPDPERDRLRPAAENITPADDVTIAADKLMKSWGPSSRALELVRGVSKGLRQMHVVTDVVQARGRLRTTSHACKSSFRGLHKLEQKHCAPVTCCSFNHDGGVVCTTSWDCAVHLYDTWTGEHLQALTGVHTEGGTLCCSFGFDATHGEDGTEYLCVGGVDRSISLYKRHGLSWGRCHPHVVQLTDVHTEGVLCCTFGSPKMEEKERKTETEIGDNPNMDYGLHLCLGSWDRTASLITRVSDMFDEAIEPDPACTMSSYPVAKVSGAVHMQTHDKEAFQKVYIRLADGNLEIEETKGSGVVSTVALFECECSELKPQREASGFPHAFQVDVNTADSRNKTGKTKYVMAVQSAKLKMQWMTCESRTLA